MTGDNVQAVTAATVDGAVLDLGPIAPAAMAGRASIDDAKGRLFSQLLAFRERYGGLIARDFPPHWRRATGYSLDQLLKPDAEFNPARLLVSSEGTLATLLEITLPAGAETDEDRSRAAPVRRARRLHGRDPGDPRDRSLRGRADGPHADQSDPLAARLRQPDRVHRGRSGRGARRRVLRRERRRARAEGRAPRSRTCVASGVRTAADPLRRARPEAAGRRLVGAQGRSWVS